MTSAALLLSCSEASVVDGGGVDAGLPACTPHSPPDPFQFWQLNEVSDGGVQCLTLPEPKRVVVCSGLAHTDRTNDALTLRFADGSTLQWIGSEDTRPLLAASVQVELQDQQRYGAVGWTAWTHRLVLRDASTGAVQFAAAGSIGAEDPSEALLSSTLGITVRSITPACQSSISNSCQTSSRTFFDTEFESSPPVVAASDRPTLVVTPTGRWQVRWARSADSILTVTGAADCAPFQSGSAYVFSRVGP